MKIGAFGENICAPNPLPLVIKTWLLLTALAAASAWGQAPSYSAASIVNASDYSPGPFAPNSVLSIFGTNLAWSARSLFASDIAGGTLPVRLNGVEVLVDNRPAPLLYVSPAQINFIVPGGELPGKVSIVVVRQGVGGPSVPLTLVDAAPALFDVGTGYAIVTDALGGSVTPESPAHPKDLVVIYLTGLGKTQPNPASGEIPLTAASILWKKDLKIYLDGTELDAILIKYAGVTPYSAGLYQINLELPDWTGLDPELLVAIGTQSCRQGLKLLVQD